MPSALVSMGEVGTGAERLPLGEQPLHAGHGVEPPGGGARVPLLHGAGGASALPFRAPGARGITASVNRLKLWAFALLVLLAGAANLWLVTQWLARASLAEADAALQAAASQLDARSQLLAAQASGLAEAAARAPAVLAALADGGEGEPTSAASVAVAAAARGMPADAVRGLLVGTAGPDGARLRVGGKAVELVDPAGGIFAEPLRGARREGYVQAGDALWFVVAAPAAKGAVAVGLPVDAPWASGLKAASGADVTLLAGQRSVAGTLDEAGTAAVVGAARAAPPRPVDAGSLQRLRSGLGWLPPIPVLLFQAPAHRVLVVSLRGTKAGFAALSLPMAGRLAPLATYQVASAAVLLLLLLAGLFLGLLVAADPGPGVPRELLAAADRIQRGDFGARVPPLPGSQGTVAAALNRAADAVQEAQATAAASRASTPPPDPFAAAPGPASDPFAPAVPVAPSPEDPFAPRAASPTPSILPEELLAAPPPPPPQRTLAPERTGTDLFAPPPLPPPPPPAPAGFAPLGNSISGATGLGTRPEDLVAPPPPAPAAAPARAAAEPAEADEAHWRQVFDEFVRARKRCGETIDGIAYDRFMAKLQANRAQLMQKHGCRTVHFSVYVKEGKAALKATPVR